MIFFFKQKTAYEIKECDWSSDVCSSDLGNFTRAAARLNLTQPTVSQQLATLEKSLGVMLPILMMADVFAVGYFRRRAHWQSLARLIPTTLAGIVIGYLMLDLIGPRHINRLIGGMVLGLLMMQALRQKGLLGGEHVPHQWVFACSMGLLAGFATMIANAAGPITIIYLLAMRLDKMRFMGTAAWFYLIFNWVKVPFQANLGLISTESHL